MTKIIFYNDTGFPYSVLAAAIRSGLLPRERFPDKNELFNVLDRCGVGRGDASIFELGQAGNDEKCLALWSPGNGDMAVRMINSFLGIFNKSDYKLFKVHIKKTLLVILGVQFNKVPWLRPLGNKLLHRAIKSVYGEIQKVAVKA